MHCSALHLTDLYCTEVHCAAQYNTVWQDIKHIIYSKHVVGIFTLVDLGCQNHIKTWGGSSAPPPSPPLYFQRGGGWYFFLFRKSPLAAAEAMAAGRDKKKCLKASWRRCYYPHQSRDASSPVCGIFLKYGWKPTFWKFAIACNT